MRPRHFNPWSFDFDSMDVDVDAIQVHTEQERAELAMHTHRQAQLAIVLRGAMTCEVPGALWAAPLQGGLWIPSGMPHSNRVTPNGRVCFLFVQAARLPAMPRQCCQIAVSPLLRELVLYLAGLPKGRQRGAEAERLRAVLLDQLGRAPTETLHLPISDEPRLRRLIDAMIDNPSNRQTAAQWAATLAMSERTLTRLVLAETGMPFGRWRQQLHLIVALQRLSMGVSVQQVSGELGYETVSAFILMFRKALGQPPRRFFTAQRDAAPAA